jgi:hypothetical protein
MTKARDLANIISGGFTADDIPNLDTAKLTTGTIASARINNDSLSAITALPSGVGGIALQAVQTTGFTAVAGRGYPCNTTSAGFTVTLPATPSAGDQVQLVDYAGTFATNNLTVNPNGLKIQTQTGNRIFNTSRLGLTFTYVDSTQGWFLSSGYLEGTNPFYIPPYSVDFLVIAGGGGGGSFGGGGAGGYRNSFSTEASGGGGSSETSLTFTGGTVYTVTVGGGGAGSSLGGNGTNSSISGTGISTITSTGGGGGSGLNTAGSGGSGGGCADAGRGGVVGSGTANQGYAGGLGYSDEVIYTIGGGGGGAGAVGFASSTTVGGNGGTGLSSSITGSSVGRAGGGAGTGDVSIWHWRYRYFRWR